MHVVRDLLYYALLCSSGMKGKKLFDSVAHLVGDLERDSRDGAKLLALQLESDLEKEQLLKDQTLMSGRLTGLQIGQFGFGIGEMHLLKGFAPRDQPHSLADRAGDAVGDLRREAFQCVVDGLAKPAWGQLLIGRRLVDGHNTANLDGVSCECLGIAGGELSVRRSVH